MIKMLLDVSFSWRTKMFNLDVITNGNNAKHYLKWSYIPDHPYRLLITEVSGSEKKGIA